MPNTVDVFPFDDGNFAIQFDHVVKNGSGVRWKSHPGPVEVAFAWGKTVKQPHETVSVWGRFANGEQVCAFSEENAA